MVSAYHFYKDYVYHLIFNQMLPLEDGFRAERYPFRPDLILM